MLVVPLQQSILETAEPEEIVLLFEVIDRAFVNRAQAAIQQFIIGEVLLTSHAVLAGVRVKFNVARVVAAL